MDSSQKYKGQEAKCLNTAVKVVLVWIAKERM